MERIPTTPKDRMRGLDSIRFICALWVFFGHGGAPALANPFEDGSLPGLVLRGLYWNIWSGSAAVMVFFVISGFCIHFPFAGSDRRPRLKEFYARRFLRLLVPLLVAVPLSGLVGVRLALFQDSILWSLLAELIYYIAYPVLRALQLRTGSWRSIVIMAFLVALAVAATNPAAGDYSSYGAGLNWLLGLPCWLLGCTLAESVRASACRPVSVFTIWTWRAAVFSAAWVCSVLRFHSPIGYPWTLNFFALLAASWLCREIQFRQSVAPSRLLEWAGGWSYSLYLVHLAALTAFARLFPAFPEGSTRWIASLIFVLAASYGFYLCIERPGHVLARKVGQRLSKKGIKNGPDLRQAG